MNVHGWLCLPLLMCTHATLFVWNWQKIWCLHVCIYCIKCKICVYNPAVNLQGMWSDMYDTFIPFQYSIFCKTANVTIFSSLCFSCVCVNLYVYVCLCEFVCVAICQEVQCSPGSRRPSDYCCLLHWQINPLNNNNPSQSLSLSYSLPSLQWESLIHPYTFNYLQCWDIFCI